MPHNQTHSVDPRIEAAAREGCDEARLLISRRQMMGLSAGFFASGMIPRTALASSTDKRVLFVILRGGMDGLHVAIPINDGVFCRAREVFVDDLRRRPIGPISLAGSDHVLHPSLQNFGRLYNNGQAAIVQGISSPLHARSHFACQYNLESGMGPENRQVPEGWLNRLLQQLRTVDQVSSGLVAVGGMPFILSGRAPVKSWSKIYTETSVPKNLFRNATASIDFDGALIDYYRLRNPQFSNMYASAIQTDAVASVTGSTGYAGITGQPYSTQELRKQFRGAGQLMSQDSGPRIGVVSIDGWDTHLGELADGSISLLLSGLDWGISEFKSKMDEKELWSKTLIVCVSEFGRTIQLNASTQSGAGTEHGIGTVALVAGGSINGRRFYGDRYDFARILGSSVDGVSVVGRHDVPATLDTRQLFKTVVEDFLDLDVDLSGPKGIFPDSSHAAKISGMFSS